MASYKTPPTTSEMLRQAAKSQEALLADRSDLLLQLADELAGDTIRRERLLDLLRNEAAAWTTAAEAIAAGHNAQEAMNHEGCLCEVEQPPVRSHGQWPSHSVGGVMTDSTTSRGEVLKRQAPKQLRLRRADRCAVCGTELLAGTTARWYPQQRVATCVGFELVRPDGPGGEAGAGARQEYERRKRAREERAREKLGGFGVAVARVTAEPQSTQAWAKGARGEEFAGARLEKHLAGTAARLLHDRRMPGHGKANIDHIAVGPGGVTVIDTKNYRGMVRVELVGGLFSDRRAILRINGRDRTNLIEGVERQIDSVRSVFAEIAVGEVDVQGALCFANVEGLPLLHQLAARYVVIDGPKPVARLANRPGDLSADQVQLIWCGLGTRLPSARATRA